MKQILSVLSIALRPMPLLFQFVTVLLIWASCSPMQVLSTSTAPGFALSDYTTFDFFGMTLDPEIDPEYARDAYWIQEEIGNYFTERGLSQAAGNSDLIIFIGMVIEEKVQTGANNIHDGPIFIGAQIYDWKSQEVEVGRYDEGTLSVFLVDRNKGNMMWKGTAQSIMRKKQMNSKKNTARGIRQLFSELP